MAKDKYYGTTFSGFYIPEEIQRKYGISNYRQQVRIVCKTSSVDKANDLFKSASGYGVNAFTKGNVSQTGNAIEIEAADTYGAIIGLNLSLSYPRDYFCLRDFSEECAAYKRK